MKTYKQLTYEQPCQIYALKKIGLSQNKMAKAKANTGDILFAAPNDKHGIYNDGDRPT